MIRRPRRIVPAVIVALALLAGSVAVAVSLIQRLSGAKEFVSYDAVASRLHDTTWASGWVLGVGIGAVVVGLILLGVALWPGRAVVVPLESEDGVTAGIARRSLRAAIGDAAAAVDGVHSPRVRLGRRKVRVRGRAAGDAGLPETVRAAVEQRLLRIAPRAFPRIETALRPVRAGGER
ncbi:DUF6286 domain-containing protein [Nocardia sp. CDC159]|uniref:DUF6286 domain-containing protein n=1 Tax=Nocardia pulmonis TaxID=2951408 RepID=A0A9X2E9P8_9NOCA|nr:MULTISPECIES: DUF6286 domain-containing protein [Nocardia]MCM6776344.1 DUF6286 domain-containing protein [Nocardia pulmonis]MCM6788768.1 DUF6286 domain-containing protein [Nocardia sp. CDC159]